MKKLLVCGLAFLTLSTTAYSMGEKMKNRETGAGTPSYASMEVRNPQDQNIEKAVQNIMYTDIHGTVRDLKDSNKYIIVDFWATWCPPCVAEIPHFIKLQSTRRDVQIIGVSTDHPGTINNVKTFVSEKNINYPVTMYNNDWQEAFGKIVSIPTTFILDKNQKIVKKYVGYQDISVFEAALDALSEQ